MNANYIADTLKETVDQLSNDKLYRGLFHQHDDGTPLPSVPILREIVDLARSVVFPGYFGNSSININTLEYHIGVDLERLYNLLCGQILAGGCFVMDSISELDEDNTEYNNEINNDTYECVCEEAPRIAEHFISRLPEIRRLLATDVAAAYKGDPAAKSIGEVISCYPAIRAISSYRFAHELHQQGVPLIPRIITELAHSETGIDIHPGAKIGERFTIDHGTGVVIGETCIIGRNVKLYQGVTLGARNIPTDSNGNAVKNVLRHPIIGDNVIIYSNSTILGRITIGHDSVIGGNIWVTENVEPGSIITQSKAQK